MGICAKTKRSALIVSFQFVDSQKKTGSAGNQPSEIEPLDGFDLDSSEPPIYRPFKPKYHLTMGMCSEEADWRGNI